MFNKYQKFYINGDWYQPSEPRIMDVVNPANGKCVAKLPLATEGDIDLAVQAARKAFKVWSQNSATLRAGLICAIADEMQARKQEFVEAISCTMGCPVTIAEELQVQGAINAFRNYANMANFVEQQQHHGNFVLLREAIGVCVLINPWNYPLSQLVGKLGPALAVGCTVVTKPAEQTPLQDLIMADIFDQLQVPAGVLNVICGEGRDIGEYLCSHKEVDMVSFTGSTKAGIMVAQSAAGTVKRVCQELGGKSPLIITSDANLAEAVRYGVEDVMLNSGQTCNSLTRMLVHESQIAEAEEIAKLVAEENVIGDPFNSEVSMGPLSSIVQQKQVLSYIQSGIDEGAKLVTGGMQLKAEFTSGAYVEPTIFSQVKPKMRIAKEEIFGPVLSIIPYRHIDEAIEIANDTEYGLASAVFAKNEADAMAIAKHIRAGQCYIQGSYFNTDAPFGGYKLSGNGREWGEEGLKEFIETKAIVRA